MNREEMSQRLRALEKAALDMYEEIANLHTTSTDAPSSADVANVRALYGEWDRIMSEIAEHTGHGCLGCETKILFQENIDRLKQQGYEVKIVDRSNFLTGPKLRIVISWDRGLCKTSQEYIESEIAKLAEEEGAAAMAREQADA